MKKAVTFRAGGWSLTCWFQLRSNKPHPRLPIRKLSEHASHVLRAASFHAGRKNDSGDGKTYPSKDGVANGGSSIGFTYRCVWDALHVIASLLTFLNGFT